RDDRDALVDGLRGGTGEDRRGPGGKEQAPPAGGEGGFGEGDRRPAGGGGGGGPPLDEVAGGGGGGGGAPPPSPGAGEGVCVVRDGDAHLEPLVSRAARPVAAGGGESEDEDRGETGPPTCALLHERSPGVRAGSVRRRNGGCGTGATGCRRRRRRG